MNKERDVLSEFKADLMRDSLCPVPCPCNKPQLAYAFAIFMDILELVFKYEEEIES